MAVVKPFRAERYDESRAGRSTSSSPRPTTSSRPEQRRNLLARSPYNVVHLTLPDSEEEAGRAIADWRSSGVADARRPACVLAPLTGLRRARRRRPDAHGARRLARGGAVREPGRPAARAYAQRAEGRQAEAAPRDADGARADLPALRGRRPDPARARARSAKWGRQALASRRRAELRRHGAPDRRRPSPLRDGARLRTRRRQRPS